MDSLTQIVLGAAVGEVVLGKKVGNRAMLWGAIAGTIPDLDVLMNFFVDDVTANEMHRGFSHSLLFCILFSPLLGFLVQKLYANHNLTSWGDWTKLSYWCLVTHPLLDAHTTWGTQFFWPLDLKLAYKNINVVDPIYTLPFLVILIIVLFIRRTNPNRQKLAWFGIILSSTYMLYTIGVKFYVDKIFREGMEQHQIEYNRYTHQPTILNSVLWTMTAETDSSYYISYYSLLDEDKNLEFIEYEKDFSSRKKMDDSKLFRRLVNLSQGWYLIRPSDSGYVFRDMRFGQTAFDQNEENIVFSYQLRVADGEWHAVQDDPPRDKMKESFQLLMSRIKGQKKVPL